MANMLLARSFLAAAESTRDTQLISTAVAACQLAYNAAEGSRFAESDQAFSKAMTKVKNEALTNDRLNLAKNNPKFLDALAERALALPNVASARQAFMDAYMAGDRSRYGEATTFL